MSHPMSHSLSDTSYAPVVLKPGREKPVLQHHPWVFSGAILKLPPSVPDGTIVNVVDGNNRWLARGFLNRTSQIQVRILTWKQEDVIDDAFWHRRLAAAVARRTPLLVDPDTTAYRIINAESDYLPGLIVDRYGDHLIAQIGILGMDQRKRELADPLLNITGCRSISERSDTAARRLEGLDDARGLLAGTPPPDQVEITEKGLRFVVELGEGQKTGFYMDQRANRQAVAAYCTGGTVLNGFSYTGAFAVHALAAGATHVTNIDSSVDALRLGERNLMLNGFDPDQLSENIAGDIFQVLRDWRDDAGGPRFDVVILDPPKFAHSKPQIDRALRGYKDINMLAMHLVKPGGILATFSCSGLVSADLFQKVIFGASVDVGRDVQILEWCHQDVDHPVAITFPEGEYLKGLICRVL
jgi:23S rRNA (cytosine1962-C5)-methyltransferase